MPHEFRNVPNVSHETLTIALVSGGGAALLLLGLVIYLIWRDRKREKQYPSRNARLRVPRTKKK